MLDKARESNAGCLDYNRYGRHRLRTGPDQVMENGEKRQKRAPPMGHSNAGPPASIDSIVGRITAAITGHRLPPGTKLGEEYLCGIFGVSRTMVRQALFRLAEEKLVAIHRGRGASVACSTKAEAHDIFEARRVVESAMASRAAERATPAQLAKLRTRNQREHDAAKAGEFYIGTAKGTQFMSEFHSMIAEIAGNRVLSDLLQILAARTSVVEVFHATAMTADNSAGENSEILRCVERGDPGEAARCMSHHLSHIEGCLRFAGRTDGVVDVAIALDSNPVRVPPSD